MRQENSNDQTTDQDPVDVKWNLPRCSVGKLLVRTAPQRAPLCQPRTWRSSILCSRQRDYLCWTSGTCIWVQYCRHWHQSNKM